MTLPCFTVVCQVCDESEQIQLNLNVPVLEGTIQINLNVPVLGGTIQIKLNVPVLEGTIHGVRFGVMNVENFLL